MHQTETQRILPARGDLVELFHQKYGEPESTGWSPRRRWRFGYFLPADVYEAMVKKLVTPGIDWIDIGGGRDLFPENPSLARKLVSQARHVVGVDPSGNILSNPFVHERVQCLIEDYRTERRFDLATLRMVVEHVAEPWKVSQSLQWLLKSGGLVVIFTVNKRSPLTWASLIIPFRWHYPIKKLFWGGEEDDTFPVQYQMNTRKKLAQFLGSAGFQEVEFVYLDDLALFGNFRFLNLLELILWKGFCWLRWNYPENCLLAVYQKTGEPGE
jgi:SAM-dependent methyltransferase